MIIYTLYILNVKYPNGTSRDPSSFKAPYGYLIKGYFTITVYRYIMIVHNKYYRHISDKKCVICIMIFIYIAPIGIYVANKRNELKQDLDIVLVFNMKYMQMTSLEDFVNFGHKINNDTVSSNVTENTFLQLAE